MENVREHNQYEKDLESTLTTCRASNEYLRDELVRTSRTGALLGLIALALWIWVFRDVYAGLFTSLGRILKPATDG